MKRIEDVKYVNEFMPDYVGFVFAGKKRLIDKKTAALLKSQLNPKIPAVGVFVNDSIENIVDLVNSNVLDIVQILRQLPFQKG